jgi:hypothetical protein
MNTAAAVKLSKAQQEINDDDLNEARAYLALDWLVRTLTPAWLDLARLDDEAAELRALPPIVDLAGANAAGPTVRGACNRAADYAEDPWDGIADDVVAPASAARAAAWPVAEVVSWDAFHAAGYAATYSRTVVGVDSRPMVEALQASALDLLDRMIDPEVD